MVMHFFVLLLSITAAAQDVGSYTSSELETLSEIRRADLGIERVYIDATSYYYIPPADLETPALMVQGAMEWSYNGQAVFTDHDVVGVERSERSYTYVENDYSIRDMTYDVDEYFGVGVETIVDTYGRQWLITHVDLDLALEQVAEYDAQVLSYFGSPEGDGLASDVQIEFNSAAGEEATGIPLSWDTVACTIGSGYYDHHYNHSGNGDIAKVDAVPMNDRQRKIVMIVGPSGVCSGTMVDDEWALTAAHCIADLDTGIELDPTDFHVCTMENLDENTTGSYEAACFGVEHLNAFYQYDGDPDTSADDFGVVHLDGQPGVGWFAISAADDSYIDDYTAYLRGFPGRTAACAKNEVTSDSLTTDNSYDGAHLWRASGDIQSTLAGYIKYDVSSAQGVSGGPYYYCPNGSGCADGHYITGVATKVHLSCYWDGTRHINPPCLWGNSQGAKGSAIRQWVINWTP